MKILGIDPGPETQALVRWDGQDFVPIGECEMWKAAGIIAAWTGTVAIEDFVVYQPLDATGRETIKAIGVLRYECWRHDIPCVEIPRADVLRHLCGATKGGDTALRAAIMDRFGGSRKAAIGTRKAPGPLYGMTGSHLLAALGVALTAADKGQTK